MTKGKPSQSRNRRRKTRRRAGLGADATLNLRTLRLLQRFYAEAIPANAIRNQDAEGILPTLRARLARLRLLTFVATNRRNFERRLQAATNRLISRLAADRWGAARKALNLFLRACTYDHHLRVHYGLRRIEPWLEVPLDSYVAGALKRTREGRDLPKWGTLKALNEEDSRKYQEVAQAVADRKGLARVHLDLYYWTKGRDRKKFRSENTRNA